jgi:hypothetical protein
VLQHRPVVLSEAERAQYFEQGYLVLPDHVPAAWIDRLRVAMAETIELSRSVTQSDSTFILEEGHGAETPRLHRVTCPQDRHPAFWQFMADPVMTDLAADVVGPDVKFHSAKLNVKSGDGSRGFKWHQDIQGWPHTDYSPVTIGVYIDGCEAGQGPIACVRGSHQGPPRSRSSRPRWPIRTRPTPWTPWSSAMARCRGGSRSWMAMRWTPGRAMCSRA